MWNRLKLLKKHKSITIFFTAVIALLCLVQIKESMAWFSTSSSIDNVMIAPTLNNDIEEGNDGIDYLGWAPEAVVFGGTANKHVQFTNNGQTAYVLRVSYADYWAAADESVLNSTYDVAGVFTDIATINWTVNGLFNTSLWYAPGDGWFYYRYVLDPGESTSDIMTSVSFLSDASVDYADATYNLLFRAEAVQYSYNAINENDLASWENFGMTYTEDVAGLLTWSSTAP